MKTKLLLLSFLMLLSVATNYAQTSAQASGIAVQGIARDNNNTAIPGPVALTFTIYYKVSGAPTTAYTETVTVTADAFGVFSHVIDNPADKNFLFEKHQMWLEIKLGSGAVISNEKFNHVPYAIAANNGVPTGSIMPYIGGSAPAGWALCNGQDLSLIAGTEALIALLGSNLAPNLSGRFLKGAGTPLEANVAPIAVKEPQAQSVPLKQHLHDKGTLGADNNIVIAAGQNVATSQEWIRRGYKNGETGGDLFNLVSETYTQAVNANTNHGHIISGSTAETAIDNSEVRPSSYGVNYIIKL